jgi:hypothetical protein
MRCANHNCQETVVRINEVNAKQSAIGTTSPEPSTKTVTWLARPRYPGPYVDPAIPEPYRTSYLEAAAILDISPRMSGVLSRRILADLLEEFARLEDYSLEKRIGKFAEDDLSLPPLFRGNLHHFREIASFGTQIQKDDQAQIVDVDKEEAEWTLDLLDRLFDYFILTPQRDREMRSRLDAKIKRVDRNPLAGSGEQPAEVDDT